MGSAECGPPEFSTILGRMVSRNVAAVCGRAALVCFLSASFLGFSFSCSAQTSASQPAAQQPATQQQTTPAPQPAQPQQSSKPLQLQDLPPDAHTLTPEEQAQLRQQRTVQAALQLAQLQARWGAGMSTAGLSASLVEVGKSKSADGTTQVAYHVAGTGFTPGDSLSLIRWPLDSQAETVMSGLTLDPNGTAICPEKPLPPVPVLPGEKPRPAPRGPDCKTVMEAGQPVIVTATGAKGEAVRIALIDNDRQKGAATTAVPFPLANEDKGCRLQVLLGLKDASMVLIDGTGFPPNTPLKLESMVGGHTRTLSPRSSADGHFIVVDLPGDQGETSGTATVRFAGITHVPSLEDSKNPPPADPQCAPSVTFPWGKGSYKAE